MTFDPSVLHPVAEHIYMLALEHGSKSHPLAVAFVAEMDASNGCGDIALSEVYEIINERRAVKGLPPLEPAEYLEDC